MARRMALLLLLVATAAPSARRGQAHLRGASPLAGAARRCEPEGRGVPPRHWLGCAADRGTPRGLSDEERLLLGRPLDPNRAGTRALAFVPGLTPRLARAVVADRIARGPFARVEDLVRVEGIGPRRLAQAHSALLVSSP